NPHLEDAILRVMSGVNVPVSAPCFGPWSRGVLGREDATIARVDGTIILALVGLIALLWSRCPIPPSLQALELGAVGLLAGRVTFVEYRLMRRLSQRGDMMTEPMILKNAVLLTAVLIALILAILVVGSAYGARTISRRRRQVAETRRL